MEIWGQNHEARRASGEAMNHASKTVIPRVAVPAASVAATDVRLKLSSCCLYLEVVSVLFLALFNAVGNFDVALLASELKSVIESVQDNVDSVPAIFIRLPLNDIYSNLGKLSQAVKENIRVLLVICIHNI
ncbi:hypothetical protein GTU79_01445 [Sodalis ligni]|uniref:hypothetical protein n=1 Tax=Sodalis ligni TaxID=2697027 RepID=UPI00193F0CB6|nr:hypothetical protein [Sodalis ligni]QWA11517.1 hypothetical protein GTU79_01445 [Sodalis ligni]